jgi:tetratricopeptide (TPR) repeat protein
MTGAARRRGQLAVGLSSLPELLEEISAGHPVIVFQNLGLSWAPRWHYAVVVGYDLGRDQIILHSGRLERVSMPVDLFLRTWKRGDFWGLVVLPPDQLPASDDQWEILRAAAALERAGQPRAAERVYASGASRWPRNWIWPYGLGNARYQRGDLRGAKAAYERALRLDPSIPEVRHNLAEVNARLAASARCGGELRPCAGSGSPAAASN